MTTLVIEVKGESEKAAKTAKRIASAEEQSGIYTAIGFVIRGRK